MGHKVKLIACDLDGTLLLNGSQTIEENVFTLIHELKKQNIIFVASSGRQYYNLQLLFAPVKDDIYYVCENGCLAYCNNKIISMTTLDHTIASMITKDILEKENSEALISDLKTCYVQPKDPEFFYHIQTVLKNLVNKTDDLISLECEPLKVSLFEKGGLKDISYWKEKYSQYCNVQTGGNEWLDFMPNHINKGYALNKLLQYLQIDPSDVIAFGDNENDIEMLKLVGCPITMEHSNPIMKDLGKYHTDYVPKSLEKILYGEGYEW